MGCSKELGPTYSVGRLLTIFFLKNMKQLSIFVDESGDFGPYAKHSPCYVITMVFHNQKDSIQEEVDRLDRELKVLGCDEFAIHT